MGPDQVLVLARVTYGAIPRSGPAVETEFGANLVEGTYVVFEPRTQHIDGAILLTRGHKQRAVHQHPHMVLYGLVLEVQVARKLVHVAGLLTDATDYPDPVLAAPFPPEEEPQGAAKLRIVLHSSSDGGPSLFIG